jgi:hypothetical protein
MRSYSLHVIEQAYVDHVSPSTGNKANTQVIAQCRAHYFFSLEQDRGYTEGYTESAKLY